MDSQRFARLGGLVVGIALFTGMLLLPAPAGMTPPAQRMAAIALLMASLWVAETLPLGVTALLPLVLFPLLGIMSTGKTAPFYANQWTFLMLGGFFIALAMQKWNLHKRIALLIIRLVGVSARRLVLGFMLATAFISLWISNTATTMMMIPIALSLILQIEQVARDENDGVISPNIRNFTIALSLGICYAANIGGVGTLVGTFPNVVFGGMMKELFPGAPEITFAEWFIFAAPFVWTFVPLMWAVMVLWIYPVRGPLIRSAGELIDRELASLGPIRRGELDTLVVAVMTGALWIFRRDLNLGFVHIPGWSPLLGLDGLINDATIAICMGSLLFLIPVDFKRGSYVMDWEWGIKVPWGLLLLFAGGFAVAAGFRESGLALWIGGRLEVLKMFPLPVMILLVALGLSFLTEMTSNTATTTMMMPILAATAVAMGIHPFLLMLPAVVSASCAFMLPVATPPNAIAFGTGRITIRHMVRAGFVINIMGAVLVTALILTMGRAVFGADPAVKPEWAVLQEAPAP